MRNVRILGFTIGLASAAAVVGLFCVGASPASAFAAGDASDADKVFVGKVSQGGMYEVEASKVAAMRASAPDVKDLALTEVHDHEGVNARLKAIAAKTGVPVSATLNAEFQARLAKLKAASAADFDQAYLTDMQQIHDKDEKLFAQEAQEGSDAYKNFAHQTDLIVKRHIGALNAPVGN
jgi:putative membrane protein